jgi:hypothetical protein
MNILVDDIDAISGLALEIMQAILTKEAEAQKIMQDEAGPLGLAGALSDFFQMAAALEAGYSQLETEELDEFGAYGLDLLDRQAYLVRQLELMDKRDTVARVFPSLALWLVRRGATIDNLEGTADGFGMLVNGLSDQQQLADMCRAMDEVIEATSGELQRDEDRSNAWRPWRVINLNSGIAATRSLDPQLMESIFDKLGRRLPHDMPGFLADGRRQMMVSNVPDEVSAVMNRYADKWPTRPH